MAQPGAHEDHLSTNVGQYVGSKRRRFIQRRILDEQGKKTLNKERLEVELFETQSNPDRILETWPAI
jgi:hypothetical protein